MRRAMMLLAVLGMVAGWGSLPAAAQAAAQPAAYAKLPGDEAGVLCLNPKDSAVMVWVPAGEVTLGAGDDEAALTGDVWTRAWFAAEEPLHKVTLDGYWIYRNEVTVGQYRKFCGATGRKMPAEPPWSWRDAHPMVNITWQDAGDYARWAGMTLPTEAQWEKAARGDDARRWPWGNEWDPANCHWHDGGVNQPVDTGSVAGDVSYYGVRDMAGNVWEWCADWFDAGFYATPAAAANPTGPEKGDRRAVRGGAWLATGLDARASYRRGLRPTGAWTTLGFRCAVVPPKVEPPKPPEPDPQPEPPQPDVTISTALEFDRPAYALGENILVHFGITNRMPEPLTVEFGGDTRGAPRALRFKVVALDAAGVPVPDPYVAIAGQRGRSGTITIGPGRTFWRSLPLMQYCDLTQPGVYTVRVYHDLGWDEAGPLESAALPVGRTVVPIAQAPLEVVMPSDEQAQAIFARILPLTTRQETTADGRTQPYADFTALRFPVYLPLLAKLAAEGNVRALDGLAATPTPAAVRVLLSLVEHRQPQLAVAARDALMERIAAGGTGGARRRFPAEAWGEELAPDVTGAAWKLLDKPERESLIAGAALLAIAGDKSALPLLLQKFDRTLEAMKDDPVENRTYPRPPSALAEMLRAVEVLLSRDGAVPDPAVTTAQGLARLAAVAARPAYRPAGWQQTAQRLLATPIPFVRAAVLERLPVPLDPVFAERAKAMFGAPMPPVQAAALSLAARAKSPDMAEGALTLLTNTSVRDLIAPAIAAAQQCGATPDQWLAVCADRLTDPVVGPQVYEQLLNVIDHQGVSLPGFLPNAADLQTRWRAFLAEHQDAIRNGARFKLDQPPLTNDLLVPGTQVFRGDGTAWEKQ